MTFVPFTGWHCLRCGQRYSPSYDGRCVTRLRHDDERLERCPGPLIRIDVNVPERSAA